MKLQYVDMQGAGRAIRVHLFIGESETSENSNQWLEGKVEISIVGTMDESDMRRAAMMHLRNVLDAEIAALRREADSGDSGSREPEHSDSESRRREHSASDAA